MTHDPMCQVETPIWIDIHGDGTWSCSQCVFIANVRADQDKRGQEYSRGWREGYGEGRQDAAMDVKDELRHGPNPHIMLACMPPMPACTGCARGWPHPVDPVARAAGKPADHNRLPTSDAKGHDL